MILFPGEGAPLTARCIKAGPEGTSGPIGIITSRKTGTSVPVHEIKQENTFNGKMRFIRTGTKMVPTNHFVREHIMDNL